MAFEDSMRAITIIASGLAAGLLVTVLFVLTPLERSVLDRRVALKVKNAQDPLIDRVNPPLVIASAIAGILLLALGDGLSDAAIALTIVGLVGVLGIAVLSFGFNFPLNRTMYAMPEEPPPEFEEVLARWTRFHVGRTVLGVTGVVAYTIAALPGVA
jgi:uncharacterized membrane protein